VFGAITVRLVNAQAAKRGPRMPRVVVVLTTLAVSLLAASTAQAARSEFFGIVQGTLTAQDRQGMANAGVRTARFLLRWKSIEPTRGTYDWEARDYFIGALASQGIRAAPFVWGSPEWVGNGKLAQPPIGRAADERAWRDFLEAAAGRYGPGGSYWATRYHKQFGADATPLPIKAWQIWNEPNLQKFFSPGQNAQESAQKYATLLRISHDTIVSQDPQAQIVLAGMPGYGDSTAWTFLRNLYQIPGTRDDFDAAALHPYACNLDQVRQVIGPFRATMKDYADGDTPLWLTELAWGSGPADRFCKSKGLVGQQQLLSSSFRLILQNREAWNVERLFWFLWRDPEPGSPYSHLCSICGTAGLLRYDRTPKPAYQTFRGFTAETTPPQATITQGPSKGSHTNDPTPSFAFSSNEAGSSFECRVDAQSFKVCRSPYTVPQRSDGTHSFSVKAIDAPGNESLARSREFTVDTTAPETTITSGPEDGSTKSNPSPSFRFASDEPDASFECRLDGGGFEDCSSPFHASDLADGSHTFQVKASDAAQNTALASRTWSVDTAVPVVEISSGPDGGGTSANRSPSFQFASEESDARYGCRLDDGGFSSCESPYKASGLADGSHTFQVKATDTAQNRDFAARTWTVDGPAEVSITAGPAAETKNPSPSFAFSSLDSDSDFRCRIDGAAFEGCSSPFKAATLADGEHMFTVKATDPAQNADLDSRGFTVDTVAPALRIKGERKVRTKKRRASTRFILKASEKVDRQCRIDSRRFKPCSWRFRTPKLRRGTHILRVKAVDRAGNLTTKRKRFKVVRSDGGRTSPRERHRLRVSRGRAFEAPLPGFEPGLPD
jgi:Glycosyl hydrolase catalytic core